VARKRRQSPLAKKYRGGEREVNPEAGGVEDSDSHSRLKKSGGEEGGGEVTPR